VLEVFICSDNLCYSAIVVATLNSLMRFYNVTDKDMPKEIRPQFVLDVEREELFIQAGLQDRVTQVYEGLVYMDFSSELMQGQGHGQYINLEMTHLPQFWLAYLNDPSDSGRIHSNVKARWERGKNYVAVTSHLYYKCQDTSIHLGRHIKLKCWQHPFKIRYSAHAADRSLCTYPSFVLNLPLEGPVL
jgi:hypothetical protein